MLDDSKGPLNTTSEQPQGLPPSDAPLKPNGADEAPAPQKVSAFADAEALKKATAAKIGKLKSSVESAEIILQKPTTKMFFMTPDDDEMLFAGMTWLDPETNELNFVAPNMWEHKHLAGVIRPTLFVPYVTAADEGEPVHGIWAISTLAGNSYTDSIHSRVLPKSRVTWVRTWTVPSTKIYDCCPAEDDYGKPNWLQKTIFEQLDIVFPQKRQIQDEEHPIIRVLAGRKQKSEPPS
jgi:hypothetical protein